MPTIGLEKRKTMLNQTNSKSLALAGFLAICLLQLFIPGEAFAQLNGAVSNSNNATSRFFARHPRVRSTAITSGVGTATGALAGLISGKGVVRGAAIGAGTGAGVGIVGTSETMKRHPIVRNTAIGTISGAGVALSSSKRGKLKNMGKGAGVGAAMGMAYGLLRTGLR